MELVQVFVIYGQENLDSGVSSLKRFSERVFPDHDRSMLVVDNKLQNELASSSRRDMNVVSGDNSNREFSGWDEGIRRLDADGRLTNATTVVLANDTFHRNYGDQYLELFLPGVTERQAGRGRLLGYVDSYPREIRLFGLRVKQWVRTSIVICSWRSLRRLLPLSLPVQHQEIFSDDIGNPFLDSADLSSNYKDYLKGWLFEPHTLDSEFRHSWHSKAELNQNNFGDFKGKARSIMAEHYLSARARNLGIKIYPVNRKRFWR
jgi:hypothetical protein